MHKLSSFPWKTLLLLLILGGGGAGAYYYNLYRNKPVYQFITVTRGPIEETVSVTGNTTPMQSVSLGFPSGGMIARVSGAVGGRVKEGKVLAELDVNDLNAQLKQARADVATQQAKLEGLRAGARPEDVAASAASLDKAMQDLANMYASLSDASAESYAKANDAVRTQLSNFFSNPETSNPRLMYDTNNSQAITSAESGRAAASVMLNKWQKSLQGLGVTSSPLDLEAMLRDELAYLGELRDFLNTVSATLDGAISLSQTTLATNKANVSTAVTEVNATTKNLNTIAQNIASQKLTNAQLEAQLNLKRAGSTASDISAQEAQVAQAQAMVESVQAKLAGTKIIAPISGTVTQFDAKVGQVASAGAPLVSIISIQGFEIDAGVSETDIGKLAVGNAVDITFDAFPGERFTGKVFYVDPAETITQGVVNYKVKVSFDVPNPRMKSGLTANLQIKARHKDNVLILPQYAILETDQGKFVKTLVDGTPSTTPVVLGIRDEKGNVEVLVGVDEGAQVLNIGLKQ